MALQSCVTTAILSAVIAFFFQPNDGLSQAPTFKDIVYATVNAKDLKLDIYLPTGGGSYLAGLGSWRGVEIGYEGERSEGICRTWYCYCQPGFPAVNGGSIPGCYP